MKNSIEEQDKIEEAQKEYMDGEFCLEVKKYLHHSGATELADRISESTTQEQSRLIIDRLVDLHGKKYGRLYKKWVSIKKLLETSSRPQWKKRASISSRLKRESKRAWKCWRVLGMRRF
jgi:hypothetical protein